jgi:ApaG protein
MNEVLSASVKVQVATHFLQQHSRPEENVWAFAYTISISNNSTETIQLLRRHWVITDTNNSVEEVKGDGVIGQQPYILPGTSYEYSSGARLQTPAGDMHGSYTMQTSQGDEFEVPIPLFILASPHVLN